MAGIDAGLPSVGAGGLRVDAQHRVWMSTSRGLFRWTPSSRLLRRYGVQQGIGSQEFLDRAITLTEEGMLDAATADRSEEHTSELQSLMRISYAVFCSQKK